jgi:putative ABC transport system permease protein
MAPSQLPRLDSVMVDVPVLVFAVAVTVVAVGLAALVPAWLATRADAAAAMTTGMRGATSGLARALRSGLVIAQMATSIVLLVGASLLGRSLMALMTTDLGVNTENVITATLDMTMGRVVNAERQLQIARDLEERVAAMPSVRSAGVGSGVPPNGEFFRVSFILANGNTTESHMVTSVPASPGYFSTLQIRLLSGRLFTDADMSNAPPVVILNREAARRFFGNDDPLGRTLPIMNTQVSIVGVVENVKYTGIASVPEGVIYRPFAQSPLRIAVLMARTAGDPGAVAADLRRMIRSYDPGINVARLQPLTAWVSDATAQPRFRAVTLSAIAVITLLLATIGLYGVMAYSTTQRTAEIGVRMAVGAQRADVIRMVLGEGTRLAVAGIVIGLIAAYWSARLLASFLYGVTTTDLAAFAGAAICLFAVALAATYVPAVGAARVDPAVALRAE